MDDKRAIDGFGAAALIGFSALLAVNQVVIKLTATGISPVFQAGLRSVLALAVLALWMWVRGMRPGYSRPEAMWGAVSGLLFALEFLFLFLALDLTTVSRSAIMLYTMPVWLGLAAHFLLPGEQLSGTRFIGMALAVAGVVLALSERGGDGDLRGDFLALLAAFGWAGIALLVRITPLSRVAPEGQLLCQLVVSAPLLLLMAPAFGVLLRDPGAAHWAGLAFQSIAVASLGFLAWFQLLKIYKASGVASFAFLAPVLAVIFGWLILDEAIAPQVWAALVLVAAGIYLINRK